MVRIMRFPWHVKNSNRQHRTPWTDWRRTKIEVLRKQLQSDDADVRAQADNELLRRETLKWEQDQDGLVRGVGACERKPFKNVAVRWETIKGRGPSKKRRSGRPDQHIVFTKPESGGAQGYHDAIGDQKKERTKMVVLVT